MSKYANMGPWLGTKTRKKMHWILMVVDIFSRKIYTRALPTKEVDNVIKAFNDIVKEAGTFPEQLDTDQGSEFGKTFDKGVDDFYHHKVNIGDHTALGVVDAAIRVFKNLIFRYITSGENWAKDLQALTKNFNSTPKKALLKFTPLEVERDKDKQALISALNIRKWAKTRETRGTIPFKIGDMVSTSTKRTIQERLQGSDDKQKIPSYKSKSNIS
eukprot:Lithocolla_globosa_v1_NODE_58_length_7390_cov_243.140014.p2 type:complete len:215 gc:universal NODE_58_length_7390_cov_243.140014:6429-7073(+)